MVKQVQEGRKVEQGCEESSGCDTGTGRHYSLAALPDQDPGTALRQTRSSQLEYLSVPLQPSLWAWGAFQPASPFYSLFSCIHLKTGNAKLNFPVLGLYVSSWGQLFLPIAAFTKYLSLQTRLKSFVFSLENTKQAAKDYLHSLCSLSQDSIYLSAITNSGYSDAAVKIPQWRLKERKAICLATHCPQISALFRHQEKDLHLSNKRLLSCDIQTWVVIFKFLQKLSPPDEVSPAGLWTRKLEHWWVVSLVLRDWEGACFILCLSPSLKLNKAWKFQMGFTVMN